MGTRVYPIGGGNPASSGNQNFAQLIASLIQNDSSVSGANVKAALDSLSTGDTALAALIAANTASIAANTAAIAAANTAIVNAGSYPYIAAPASPNAFNDEFLAGSSPDLAVRGYTVVNSAGTTLTRSGNIDPWNATGPAGNTYWSTIIGSWLFLQAAPGVQIDVYKTITLAAGDSYYVRTAGSFCFAPAANGRFNEVGLYGASGAALDANNRVFSTCRDDVSATGFLVYDIARVTAGATGSGATGRFALGHHDIRGIRFDSGTTHYAVTIDSQSGEVKTVNCTGAPAAATLTRVGFRNLFSSSGGAVAQIWGLDFIRKFTANAWPIS